MDNVFRDIRTQYPGPLRLATDRLRVDL